MIGLQCLPAVSTTFDSARMLEPHALQVGGYGSFYTGQLHRNQGNEWGLRTLNIGLTTAYGLSEKFNLKARFERTLLKDRAELFDLPILEAGTTVHYAEIALKFGWNMPGTHLRQAVSLPIGNIFYKGGNIWYLTPSAIATYSWKERFEISLNGKLHFWYKVSDSISIPWTSFGFGFGFSKDLNRWAIRPEINTDFFNVSLGVGFAYVFEPLKHR